MGLIPKVRCSRCDKSYSGLKNKCPYCGAHRGRGGKRATDTGDAAARFMIKMLLLLALVAAVISMIFINFDDEPSGGTISGGTPGIIQGTPAPESGEDGEETPTSTPTLTPPPTPPPIEATSLGIRWQFWSEGVNEMTIRVGDVIEVWAHIFPTDASGVPNWSTSEGTVANLLVNHEDLRRASIEGRSVGTTTIAVVVDGLEAEIIVRVRS